ncbi:UvrD-helicase domain-containing protein [Candidatus Woesebacteria bacterium]|nr:UvrD-helicase domain-containing protein [Candidatus Woesebacteria bacterium]MCD8507157.1 UvrD-helicase domain-containing protein [Candidatus Woesebacteria bacterium]MCD8545950.1 UvrD-helicase domain-containing protein [Candidatus Woesebacteria bacterium]
MSQSEPTYLSVLNEEQRQAVLHGDGPAMVLAGAGSGKTRVLTTRVAYLIDQKNIQPEEIVLLTFTNKAAKEMEERVRVLTGYSLPYAGTFHRLCARLLRRHAELVGLSQSYVIYDSDDQLSLIKLIAKELNLDSKKYHPRALVKSISESKQQLITPEEYEQFARGPFQTTVARVYRIYEKKLIEAGAVDFDNMLSKVVELFRKNEHIRKQYQQQWKHVLIDEYQDTNHAQYVLTKLIAFPQNNLYVVGDASQAIYGWRGADYRNLLKLRQDFANVEEYRLERNYRSTPSILEAASNVIRNNTMHPVLELWTDSVDTHKLRVLQANDGTEEAHLVANIIAREHPDELSDVAILYRTNAQSREFEEALLRKGIPYKLVGGVAFYSRKEIKDILAYLQLVYQPNDVISENRVLKLGKRRYANFTEWRDTVRNLETGEVTGTTQDLLEGILKSSNYMDKLDEKDPTDLTRIENIQELHSVAAQFPELPLFLEQVALVGGEREERSSMGEGPAVTLMSLHAAKGLEFPYVFLVGLEEGLFPHSRSLQDREQMEEERRLCYVGITRAKSRLVLSYAQRRLLYGNYSQQMPARFLREIPAHAFEDGASPFGQNARLRSENSHSETPLDDPMLDAILDGSMDIDEWLGR